MNETSKLNYDYIKQAIEIPMLFVLSLKKQKQPKKLKKILIINTCLIGDISASIPAMIKFIKRHKQAKIDLIVPSTSKSLAEKIRGINKVYIAKSVSNRKSENLDISKKELRKLMKNNYDLILVARLSRNAYKILKKLKTKSVKASFLKYTFYLLHLLRHVIYKGKVKQYREVNFEWFGEEIHHFNFNEIFNFSEKDYKKIKKMPIMKGKEKKIIIHAGRGWRKHWENKKWVELLRKINRLGKFKFVFVGGEKQEEDDFNIIQRKLNFKVHSIIRKVNLAELLLIMRLSNYFIGIDSGPRNMAHLADLRSLCLLGPGPKHFMPINNKDIIVDKSNCKCTQLFCFKKKTCMQKIKVNDVFKAFKKLVGKK